MQNQRKEKFILDFIKYGPIVFVITLSFIITQIALQDKEENFQQEIKHIEETFLLTNKKRIQDEVDEVYTYVQSEKENSENLLKKTIKNRVYEAHEIAKNIVNSDLSKDTKTHIHSKKSRLNTVKNALGAIRFNNGRGYIFMHNIKGVMLLQPLNKEFEGKNILNYDDINGYKFVKNIVKTIKNKTEAYDTYYWFKEGDRKNSYKKMSFYKYFEPLSVAIGSGEYIDDFENELKQRVLERINKIRYGESGYIFVYDLEGNCLAHFDKNKVGENRMTYQDKDGKFILKEMIDLVKEKKEGFYSYESSIKPLEIIQNNSKISYLKLFKEWNWMIGTGFYTDTLVQEIEKKKTELAISKNRAVEKIISFSLLITFIFILISSYISKHIRLRFEDYKQSLLFESQKTIEKEKQLVQQSKMAIMGEMIGNIAHQWKQPLSLISMSNGMIQLNQIDENTVSKEELQKATENIDNSVTHLSNTIDDFRNFFRPNKQKEYFNIKKAFDKTNTLMNSQLYNNSIEIKASIDDIEVFTYQNELLQVLINIFKNAKDELIKLQTESRIIFVDVKKEQDNLLIMIKDTAGGIPENIIENVFDSYFTTKGDEEGTGIGLYMCKQIVENMEGKISVQNKEFVYENVSYTGAEFTINLPLKS